MKDEPNDSIITGKEMTTIKSTTVNSIILKDAIEQHLLHSSPSLEVGVGSIEEIYPGFALIGRAPTLLHSHWSRTS